MSDDDNTDYEEAMRNPYRDDPVWEAWHSQANGVQGGVEDSSTSESDEENGGLQSVDLPTTCVCQQCRSVYEGIGTIFPYLHKKFIIRHPVNATEGKSGLYGTFPILIYLREVFWKTADVKLGGWGMIKEFIFPWLL
jgi:hypothetical protein